MPLIKDMQEKLFRLPRSIIILLEISMVGLWAASAFWGAIFILGGLPEINSLFNSDKLFGFIFTAMGFSLLLFTLHHIYKVRSIGLATIVNNFLNKRFLEIMTTVIFMLVVAIIVGQNIHFIITDILTLPLFIGTSFGHRFSLVMKEAVHIPFANILVLGSSWLLQLLWMYYWSRLVVKIILSFNLRSQID